MEGLAHGLLHLHPRGLNALGANLAAHELEQVGRRLARAFERPGSGRAVELLAHEVILDHCAYPYLAVQSRAKPRRRQSNNG